MLSLENTLLESSQDHSYILLLPFPAFLQIIPVTASDVVLCLSDIQSPNALCAAVNIYFRLCAGSYCDFNYCQQLKFYFNSNYCYL